MRLWKTLINAGNVEFSLQNYPSALESYQQALKHSHVVFVQHINQDADAAIAIIIISYFNIADTQLELNDPKSAYLQYEKAFQFITSLQKFSDDQRIINSTFKASKQLQKQWIDCLQRYQDQLENAQFSHWKSMRFYTNHNPSISDLPKKDQGQISKQTEIPNNHLQHVFH